MARDAVNEMARRGYVAAAVLDNGETLAADQVILAIGHSARDTFKMSTSAASAIEPKPFL